jgi:DNA-binding sugar fermentation-stimulating protein
MSDIIYKLPNLIKTSIIPKPNGSNKSPFLIFLDYYINKNNICHSKAQKCCGLLAPNNEVYITKKLPNTVSKKEPLSKFTAQLAIYKELNNPFANIKNNNKTELVCVNPDIAEHIVEKILIGNFLKNSGIAIKENSLKSQVSIKHIDKNGNKFNSRFDFTATNLDGDKTMIFEVKTVVIADYENDIEKIEKFKIKNGFCSSKKFDEKIAIFPKGFRARKSDTISTRANHHLNHLSYIQSELYDKYETYLLFIIQRSDIIEFQPYKDDPLFVKTLQNAHSNGVNIRGISIKWNNSGEAKIHNDNVHINYLNDEK